MNTKIVMHLDEAKTRLFHSTSGPYKAWFTMEDECPEVLIRVRDLVLIAKT